MLFCLAVLSLLTFGSGVPLTKGNTELRRAYDTAFNSIVNDGTYVALAAKNGKTLGVDVALPFDCTVASSSYSYPLRPTPGGTLDKVIKSKTLSYADVSADGTKVGYCTYDENDPTLDWKECGQSKTFGAAPTGFLGDIWTELWKRVGQNYGVVIKLTPVIFPPTPDNIALFDCVANGACDLTTPYASTVTGLEPSANKLSPKQALLRKEFLAEGCNLVNYPQTLVFLASSGITLDSFKTNGGVLGFEAAGQGGLATYQAYFARYPGVTFQSFPTVQDVENAFTSGVIQAMGGPVDLPGTVSFGLGIFDSVGSFFRPESI